MRNQVDIDAAVSRAIIIEIGERLQALLGEDELPPSLKSQLDRLNQLDDQLSPSVVPEQEFDTERRVPRTVVHRTFVSPGWWTAIWHR
jgi:hypothetical protein